MDRNVVDRRAFALKCVALRKESVDRNVAKGLRENALTARSLSARRAWIEISVRRAPGSTGVVALRKESVDRNHRCDPDHHPHLLVALRKESVDRNRACTTTITICTASLSARRAWIEIQSFWPSY